jgi:hypothetical protein
VALVRESATLLRWGWVPIGGLVVALLAACTAQQAGQATGSGGASGTSAPVRPSTLSLPPRPRNLPLTGIDPCSLLTATQQAKLGVDPGVEGHPDVNWHNPQCGFQLTDPGTLPSYNVQTVTSAGIQFWLNPLLANNTTPVDIGGFPAVDVTSKAKVADGCQTVVSVADGQMLIVQFDFPPTGTTATKSCVNTEQVAAAAVATLQTAN